MPAGETAAAAIDLAKIAQRLPALLVGACSAEAAKACDPPLMLVAADAVAQFREAAIASLAVAAEATIPLTNGLPARFVIFRDWMGGTPIAVIVGKPDLAQPVPVRLHSALTGDVFGSRAAIAAISFAWPAALEQRGGGIILYLEQEGRGLGLANGSAPISCRTPASTPSTPTPCSASTTTSATTASRCACCRCWVAPACGC